MKTATRINQMKKLYASLTDPAEKEKAKRERERAERRLEKRSDVGIL